MSFFKGTNSITPWINVVSDYGADPTGVADSAAACNSAISAANSNGYSLYFPPGTYKIGASLAAITRNGVKIRGDGRKVTTIAPSFASGNVFTFGPNASGGQFASIENLSFEASVFRTSGFDLNVNVSNFLIRDVTFKFSFNPISVVDSSEAIIENIDISYITGNLGVDFDGTSGGGGSFGFRCKNIVASNPYVVNPAVNNLKTFIASTAYSVNDVFVNDGWLWQVTTAGTSGLTGPAAPSTTTWHSTSISNGGGTLQVRAICKSDLAWLVIGNISGNGANSWTVLGARLTGGNIGVRMEGRVGSVLPQWIFAYGLEISYAWKNGIFLERGYGLHATDCWVTRTLTGNGIQAESTYSGEIILNSCRVTESGNNGILMAGNPDFKIDGCFVYYNGLLASNTDASLPFRQTSVTANDITVLSSSNGFSITSCSLGFQQSNNLASGKSNTWTQYGISIGSSCNNFVVVGNMTRGHKTGNILNSAGTGVTKVVAQNADG